MLRALALLALSAGAWALDPSQTDPSQTDPSQAAPAPGLQPTEGDYTLRDFTFQSGEKLAELRMHYTTLGRPSRDAAGHVINAVMVMHGTGGSGRPFLGAGFGGVLFGKGQLLDAGKYYIILPDAIGHGKSSKPSDGLRARFPHYRYDDMVRADYLLVHDGLQVDHLRLVMGTSMGAMHTWVWGEMYPDFMDALMPLASAPVEIAGRNRMFRAMVIDSIRSDPEWRNGEYTSPPHGLMAAQFALFMMTSSPLQLHKANPTHAQADRAVQALKERALRTDANDMLYQYESSTDYNPSPMLAKIKAPLYAINSADDEVNPPELGIMEREIKRVARGRYILIPTSDETRGHGTHSRPILWQNYLWELLHTSEVRAGLLNPKSEVWAQAAPPVFQVKVATTGGLFTIEAHRDWAPQGVDRFYHLARAGFYDDSRFFRVIQGDFAQFGIPGNPEISAIWRNAAIPDDPVTRSNTRGFVAYAMTGPAARTTQIYIVTGDRSRQDKDGFAPFGQVVQGMDVVDKLYSGYGESAGGGMRGGKQGNLFAGGNAYLDQEFPKLDKLLSTTVN